MAKLLLMPSLSPTMETGVISQWNKKEGEFIEVGEVLAEVETDKAVMDYEMADEGYVRKLLVTSGVELAVGMPIAILAETLEEDIAQVLEEAAKTTVAPSNGSTGTEAPAVAEAAPPPPAEPAPAVGAVAVASIAQEVAGTQVVSTSGAVSGVPQGVPLQAAIVADAGAVRISPYALKLAESRGVAWRGLQGSGPGGRIVARDIEQAILNPSASASAPAATSAATPQMQIAPGVAFQDVPLTMMRKAIARKMEESKQTVPHFQVTRKIRAEKLLEARAKLNEDFPGEAKISLNDLIVKACAAALLHHPTVNSQFLGDRVRQFASADISVAVATEEGLLTPVLRAVETKGLRAISAEVRELAVRARAKKLAPEEYSGGTFTVSNLGMFGVTEFNGIINTPQASLLAVSGVIEEPVVEAGTVVPGRTMNLTLSSDHRVVDGATAAQFLVTLAGMLENPVAMLL